MVSVVGWFNVLKCRQTDGIIYKFNDINGIRLLLVGGAQLGACLLGERGLFEDGVGLLAEGLAADDEPGRDDERACDDPRDWVDGHEQVEIVVLLADGEDPDDAEDARAEHGEQRGNDRVADATHGGAGDFVRDGEAFEEQDVGHAAHGVWQDFGVVCDEVEPEGASQNEDEGDSFAGDRAGNGGVYE